MIIFSSLLVFMDACIVIPTPSPPTTTTTAAPTTTVTTTTAKPTTLKPVTCPDLGTNCACSDNVLNIVHVATADLCSAACDSTAGCTYWTYLIPTKLCFVLRNCMEPSYGQAGVV